jgi:hypothetical protein
MLGRRRIKRGRTREWEQWYIQACAMMNMTSSWVDVGPPLKSVWGVPDGCCLIPRFTPNTMGPIGPSSEFDWEVEGGGVVLLNVDDDTNNNSNNNQMSRACQETRIVGQDFQYLIQPAPPQTRMDGKDAKGELHKVLSSVQASEDLGVYLCESFRDPRREYMDDYLAEVADQAVSIDDMHRLLGRAEAPLSDKARTRFNHLARLLERLSKRIDRVLQQA